jgi:valyl-tRNA synthetase
MGFDDNGLATERFIEKKCGVTSYKLGRSAFIELCLKETHEVEQQFQELWKSIGLSVDWSLLYSTISPKARKISQESFIRLYNKGHVYRRNEPALYCTACRTSVAQAELDDALRDSVFYDIAFSTQEGKDLVIATTRPELLPSCVALLFNPADERYQHLAGTKAITPLFNHEVPIIADEAVQIDKGTGLVMCCTFGDKTDIEWFKKHKLEYRPSVGLNGVWRPETGLLAGLKAAEARTKVIEALTADGFIKNKKPIQHAVNIHERCKKDIEYVMLPQWFLNILPHKETFINQGNKINWHPTYMKSRFSNWVENIGWDWCLSRQRYYGIPFPVWHCTSCNHILLADINSLPIDPQEKIPNNGICPSCKASTLIADTDVMDTWNTSSLTPQISNSLTLKSTENVFENADVFLPMSMRPQAHDIIRTWAFYTIVKAWMHSETIPWKDVVISGHVLSSEKEKISKSQGNSPLVPQNLLQQWPADVVRFWTASGALGTDIAFSENQLKIGQKLVTKLWNAFIFIGEHTKDVDLSKQPERFDIVNQWMLHQVSAAFKRYQQALDSFEYNPALAHIEQMFWTDLCDNYLEIVKDQLFNPVNYNEQQVAATKWTLAHVGIRILQLYAPYIPFVTDAIYRELYKEQIGAASLHVTTYQAIQHEFNFEQATQDMVHVLAIVNAVRKLKTEQQLSLKTEIAQLTLSADKSLHSLLSEVQQIICGVTKAKAIQITAQDMPTVISQNDQTWTVSIKVGA